MALLGGLRRCTALVAITLLVVSLTGCAAESADGVGTTSGDGGGPVPAEAEFVLTQLPGYPHDEVPLYEVKVLETVYYSVRNDPQRASEGLRNIYHSVYESNIPASEVLEYYTALCDTIDSEMTRDEQLYGTIGEYDIFLNTGRHNDKEMIYLSVDLPESRVDQANPFFEEYPDGIVELPPSFKVFEEMYYDSIISAGEIMYDRHFDIADLDGDQMADLQGDARLAYFEERYAGKPGFEVNREYLTVEWQDGDHTVVVAFMQNSNRGVVSVRRDR